LTILIAGIVVTTTIMPGGELFAPATTATWETILLGSAVIWLMAFAFGAGMLGYGQTLVVRSLVGLNEGTPCPYHVTYRVKTDLATVRTVFTEGFLRYWRFKEVPHQPEVVLKSRIYLQGMRVDNLITVAEEKKGQTLIHGTAFIEDLYEIRANEVASNRLDQILNAIVGCLGVAKGNPFVDQHIKNVADKFVAERTRTKFALIQVRLHNWVAALGQMEKHYRNVIFLTLIAWGLMDFSFALLYINHIPFDPGVAVDANEGLFGLLVAEVVLPALAHSREK
jgi:hypothetical protein